MKEKEKGGWLPIVGLILLIAVLFAGVKLVFAGLGYVIPQDEGPEETGTWYQMYNEQGEAVRYTLREPGEIDLSAPDIAQWMEQAAGELEQTPETEGIVFWLYRQDTDEYLLYLPDQDRSLLEGGLTASEETEEDSEVCLVLRARTPENSKPVAPEETLYCFATTSDSWNGIRVRVILDGREQEVRKLTSIGDRLYSTEETYIGRDRLEGSRDMSRRTLRCLRCGGTMELLRREFLQLGKTGWVLGDLDNLLAGALDVDILCCSDCGKLEFFRGEWSELEDPEGSGIARMECPSCGRSYELDSPKCPFCGKKNTRLF